MRPIRLELEGFGAFRDAVVVDFEGVDLFALAGPTGSGKTTVIDGICFALYGSIPRYDDRRLVAPAISGGCNEARIRLDFRVGDEMFTAVRVVRRTPKGATTKEARLERSATGEVLAGNEKEVTAEAERILGLSFDHFTTCVVLPQGEFARFLHEKPEQRQELLVKLLDLGVYERMAVVARRKASDADRDGSHIARRIDDLAGATPEAKAAADARVATLASLRGEIDARLPGLTALSEQADAARDAADEAERSTALLEATVAPSGIDAFGAKLAEAGESVASARDAALAAEVAVDTAESALAALPARADVDRLLQQHAERGTLLDRKAKGAGVLAEAVAAEAAATEALVAAERDATEAAAVLESAKAEHRAHAVVADLVVGDPCPVCQQVVATLPSTAAPRDLVAASSAHESATAALAGARRVGGDASTHRARCETTLEHLEVQLVAIGSLPPAAELEGQLAAVVAAEAEVGTARQAAKDARVAREEAERTVIDLQRQEAELRAAFDRARDAVAALAPPPRGAQGLAADWAALEAWANASASEQRAAAVLAREVATQLDLEQAGGLRALAELCAAADVDLDGRAPRDAVIDAVARAEGAAARLADELRDVEKLRVEAAEAATTRDLHATMARLLGSTGFEKWLLDEALDVLAAGASELLVELSGGQYSLGLDEKRSGFVVVDHRNADETRMARTLSGGETFLASLALALALADQLSILAASGAARLDAIFLDEGFGTLDPATLDIVASAIEELGSRGRMVGIVSHVAELAERVSVRFEVTKGPHSSTVERVDR